MELTPEELKKIIGGFGFGSFGRIGLIIKLQARLPKISGIRIIRGSSSSEGLLGTVNPDLNKRR